MLQKIVNLLQGNSVKEFYKCSRCSGKGRYKEYHSEVVGFSGCESWETNVKCEKCNGTGKLDWVEKVVGKRGDV